MPWKSFGFAAAALATTLIVTRSSKEKPDALTQRRSDRLEEEKRRRLTVALTIQRPIEEVIAFWQALPLTQTSKGLHYFVPGRCRVVRDAVSPEVVWETDGPKRHRGRSLFKATTQADATLVTVLVNDLAPSSRLSGVVRNLIVGDEAPEIRDELKRIKQILETGVIATTRGQSVGKCKGGHR